MLSIVTPIIQKQAADARIDLDASAYLWCRDREINNQTINHHLLAIYVRELKPLATWEECLRFALGFTDFFFMHLEMAAMHRRSQAQKIAKSQPGAARHSHQSCQRLGQGAPIQQSICG